MVGIALGGSIAQVQGVGEDVGLPLQLDQASLEQLASAAVIHDDLEEVRLLGPVSNPGKILSLAANLHPSDEPYDIDPDQDAPQIFMKPSSALIGPDDVIPAHKATDRMVDEI